MKTLIIAVSAGILIGIVVAFGGGSGSADPQNANNVSIANGKQIIQIDAKGGYWPRVSYAKADMPTTIKFNTKGTFDCSSLVTIPGLNYRANLMASGESILDVAPQKSGTKLQGLCGMGMYNFVVNFN